MKTLDEAYEEVKHLQDTFSIDKEAIDFVCSIIKDDFLRAGFVELGSHKGFSTCLLASQLTNTQILSVDNSLNVPYTEREELFRRLGYTNITCVNKDAETFLKEEVTKHHQYSAIFHDASHGDGVIFEYVLSAYLADTGFLVIHDWEQITNPEHVTRLLRVFEKNYHQDAKGRVTAVFLI